MLKYFLLYLLLCSQWYKFSIIIIYLNSGLKYINLMKFIFYPGPAFNDYTINLNGNHLSGIACSSISTTVTSNKRKIIYHKNGILDSKIS